MPSSGILRTDSSGHLDCVGVGNPAPSSSRGAKPPRTRRFDQPTSSQTSMASSSGCSLSAKRFHGAPRAAQRGDCACGRWRRCARQSTGGLRPRGRGARWSWPRRSRESCSRTVRRSREEGEGRWTCLRRRIRQAGRGWDDPDSELELDSPGPTAHTTPTPTRPRPRARPRPRQQGTACRAKPVTTIAVPPTKPLAVKHARQSDVVVLSRGEGHHMLDTTRSCKVGARRLTGFRQQVSGAPFRTRRAPFVVHRALHRWLTRRRRRTHPSLEPLDA